MPYSRDDAYPGRYLRTEDARLVTGRGRFVTNLLPANCLHVSFVRSPYARAAIRSVDTTAARGAGGVVTAITGADVEGLGALPVNQLVSNLNVPHWPILAMDTVNAVGQPVAAVVATRFSAGIDAAELIEVDYVPGEPVLSGIADEADTLFASVPGNRAVGEAWQRGDVDAAFAKAAVVVGAEIRHARIAPASLEPRAAVAEVRKTNGGDLLTVWLPSQSPQRARTDLASILDIDEAAIRVIAPDVGGAFGMKASLYPEDVVVAWAALQLGQPVRWTASRSDEFLAATHGRGIAASGDLAVASDGKLLGLRAHICAPLGHWLPFSAAVPARNAGRILPGPYVVPAIDITAEAHVSNTAPVGIYRGAGRPEAALLMERLIEKAALAVGLDTVEMRRRNMIVEFPFDTPTGQRLDVGHYPALLEQAWRAAGGDRLRSDLVRRRDAGEIAGVGTAFYIEPSGVGWESARVELRADGTVLAATGSCAQGQGRETATAQIVADALGVPSSKVAVSLGDTECVPKATGALASRSTPIGGSALLEAARAVAARAAAGEARPIAAESIYEAPHEAWGYGCAVAVVGIDRDTGTPTVEQLAWVDDCGRVINPVLVEGQIVGGIAQGLGEALMERLVYDEHGQLLTGSFMDYALPRASNMPPISLGRRETPTPHNLIGARGVGEAGAIGAPAAVMNAVLDALAPFCVEHLDPPLTSERIWRAMNGLNPGEL